jgi:phosphohistidine swiveling domain-containing protein/uncharacterized protein with GYD domain
MAPPLILSLETCSERTLVGGKAAGLGRLLRAGFRVPQGICLTTAVYQQALGEAKIAAAEDWARARHEASRSQVLDRMRARVGSLSVPRAIVEQLSEDLNALAARFGMVSGLKPLGWAVRSSAVVEDGEQATYGGLYRTVLGVTTEQVPRAIAECWSSIWCEAAYAYIERADASGPPGMAVIIQPLLQPVAAGVAYSQHPVTADPRQVVINAVFGLAEPLVAGRVGPDQFVVAGGSIVARTVGEKFTRQVAGGDSGVIIEPVPAHERGRPALADSDILKLAGLVRRVEGIVGHPVDLEWALQDGFWLLQARPITSQIVPSLDDLSDVDRHTFVWSRANFKETLPELPSPLALSFVRRFMDVNILARYRALGCRIPPDVVSVRVFHGRPYINLTLVQSLMSQLGGDPAQVAEQMGGESAPVPPEVRFASRMSGPRLLWALLLLQIRIWHAGLTAHRRFKELADLAATQWDPTIDGLSETDIVRRMDTLNQRLERQDLTFAIVSGVSQSLYALGATLARRLQEWRPCLNAATRGLGTIISARQILWLQQLAEEAREEPVAHAFLAADQWEPSRFQERLAGSRFLGNFDRFLEEYGHRAVGESDVMSPRFAERPDYLLGIIRRHLLLDPGARHSVETLKHEQAASRVAAVERIRRAFGWRIHEWLWFLGWYTMLRHYLGLRETNRHALMLYLAAARHVLLILARKLCVRGYLGSSEDIFFLTTEEVRDLVAGLEAGIDQGGAPYHCKVRVAARRAERRRHESEPAPHTVHGPSRIAERHPDGEHCLQGLPISGGVVRGPVRRVLSPAALGEVQWGEILVAPVIDPGMAPAFGLAAGLVIEMGGLLSHGAIIAREYGLPAVVNVAGATTVLKDGELVRLDADRGEITRLGGTRQD